MNIPAYEEAQMPSSADRLQVTRAPDAGLPPHSSTMILDPQDSSEVLQVRREGAATARHAISRLPPEILSIILENLPRPANWESPKRAEWDFMSSLYACNLVSREWNAVALPLVFRDVIWTPRGCQRSFPVSSVPLKHQLLPLSAAIEESYCCRYPHGSKKGAMVRYIGHVIQPARSKTSTLADFAGFLSSSPSVCPYIRRLRLDLMRYGVGELQKASMATLMSVLKVLPHLHVLHIHGFNDRSASPRSPGVRGLSLVRLRISYHSDTYNDESPSGQTYFFTHDITTLLSYFDHVEELEVVSGKLLSSRRTVSDTTSFPGIKTLVLTSLYKNPTEISGLYGYFAQSPLLNSVQCLIMNHDWVSVPDVADEKGPFHAMGARSSIEELRYDLWDNDRPVPPMALAPYNQLRKLSLRIHNHFPVSTDADTDDDDYLVQESVLQRAAEFFASNVDPRIEDVTLVICLQNLSWHRDREMYFERCRAGWDALDCQMARLWDVGRLKRMTVKYVYSGSLRDSPANRYEIDVRIRGMLPRTDGPERRLKVRQVDHKSWASTMPGVVWG